MKKLLIYLREYRLQCILAPAFKMLEASFELIVPLVIASLIDNGIRIGNSMHIYKMVGILVILALVGLTAAILAQFFAAKAAIGFATKLRTALFEHLLGLSYSDVDILGTSTMITRMTSDVNQTQNGVNMFLRLFLRSPFVVLGAMIMAFTIDFKVALIFAITIFVLSVVVATIMFINVPALKRAQSKLDKVTQSTRENLNGIRVLRAFRLEKHEINSFRENNSMLAYSQKKAGRISALMNPLTYILINFGIIAVIYTGGIRVSLGILSEGQVVALYNYMSQILVELIKLANLVVTLNKAIASGNRISDVFDIQPSMIEGTDSNCAELYDNSVEFKNVSFTYEGAGDETLMDISFTIKKGQTIGIIGGTGSGKTTLAGLITRFYDASKGDIYINERPISGYTYETLHKIIGIVMQKAVLFAGTVADNLRMGDANITEEDMWEALKMAQVDKVIMEKGGLQAKVQMNGKNFSGGQRQRISIARTLVLKPEIVILDDSTSALDYATDLAFRRALRELPKTTTVFIISQRTSSLKHADNILVLEDGNLVATGTHEQLLNTSDVYREIHLSQLHSE